MVRSFTLSACVALMTFGAAIAAEQKPKAHAEPKQQPQPESIAAEAAEVSRVGGVVGEPDDDGMGRLEDEMIQGEDNDGCEGAIGDEDDLLGCSN